MSGEMTGVIIGGIALVAALPYVVAGAAAVGATVGAVKLAGVVVRHAAQRRRYGSSETKFSSKQLRSMYGAMSDANDKRRDAEEKLQARRARQVEKETEQIRQLTQRMEAAARTAQGDANAPDVQAAQRELERLQNQIGEHRRAIERALAADMQGELQAIRDQSHREARRAIEEMEQLSRAEARMMDWQTQDERLRAQQRLYVEQSLKDARQSVTMLRALHSLDEAGGHIADSLAEQLSRAQEQAEGGLLEAALAITQNVITQCAVESLRCSEAFEERENEAELLLQELEMLKAEMDRRRVLEFRPDGEEESVQEDLNEFCQGEYERVQAQISGMIEAVENREQTAMTAAQIYTLRQNLNDVLRPNAIRVMETSERVLISYYEKLAAMDIVADFMDEQGYTLNWGESLGGDLSEKMVVHFVNDTTGNTVAVTLDGETTADDLERLTMDLMMFYDDGEDVSEEQKRALRAALKKALGEHDLSGALQCAGRVNQSSSRQEYNDVESVRAQTPRRLFRHGGAAQ